MKFSTFTIVEIVLFNLAILFIYQPQFVFELLKLNGTKEAALKKMFAVLGIITICALFAWSFFFGATLLIYKQTLL